MFLPNARDGLPALLEKISSEPGCLDQHIPLTKLECASFLSLSSIYLLDLKLLMF
ncbi:hypothetical protein RDI58_011905 [Solanum bulbocastanum]|uniref:Uncharacterized protein n=1 Tax=Solanum bulbocastanum TaxID=147425 RepID=A0AAN8TSB5_SOLBU